MNCPNCGAAMELVESKRYFRCTHCGTFHFPTTVEEDGIRIVGAGPEAVKCPLCATSMAHALLDDDHPIDFCGRCRGMLMPRATFAVVVLKRRAWATSPPDDPVPLDRTELDRQMTCPKCGGRFETYPHLGPGTVVIDSCRHCDLIWLDFGEMRRIVDAPGGDRGSKHVPRIDEEFVRQGWKRDEEDEDEEWLRRRGRNDPFAFLIDVLFND
jgi:Zn-finger nucleic acid-binding protein